MTKEKTQKILRALAVIGIPLLLALLAVFLIEKIGGGLPCPFFKVTGYRCPGCGNTRAAMALVHLRFRESLRFNYAYPAEFFYLGKVYVIAAVNFVRTGKLHYLPKYPALEIAFLVLLIAWGVVRNLLGI